MNKRKIIKYILIAVPVLFLAKWYIETAYYNSNKTPEINPNPQEKLRIYGTFPLENDVNMKIAIQYINKNPKCDYKVWIEGVSNPNSKVKIFPTNIKNQSYESTVDLDYYKPGICKWEAYEIYAYTESKIYANIIQKERREPESTVIGIITNKRISTQGKALEVECKKEKSYMWKGLDNEISWIELGCWRITENSSGDGKIDETPTVSNSQKTVEINFIDKGWRK